MNRVRVIIDKEWAEVLKNKMILYTAGLMPALFVVIPLVMLYMTNKEKGSLRGMENITSLPAFAGMDPKSAAQVLLVNQFMFYFLMIPLIVPIFIASYSIIGEKQQRSLEPLLATPIRVWELLLGKVLAAAMPAVALTWVAFAAYAVLARFVATDLVYGVIVSPMWLLALIVLAPLFTVLSVSLAVIISSRVNDVRLAEQIGGLLVLPFVAVSIAATAGKILLNFQMFALGALAVAFLDVAVVYLGAKLFQRETILTKWK